MQMQNRPVSSDGSRRLSAEKKMALWTDDTRVSARKKYRKKMSVLKPNSTETEMHTLKLIDNIPNAYVQIADLFKNRFFTKYKHQILNGETDKVLNWMKNVSLGPIERAVLAELSFQVLSDTFQVENAKRHGHQKVILLPGRNGK